MSDGSGSTSSSGESSGRTARIERHWWTLIAVCMATFMLLVDVTIVQVALPTIQRKLGASFSDQRDRACRIHIPNRDFFFMLDRKSSREGDIHETPFRIL